MLFVRKRATKHDVGPEFGVEGSPREVLRVEEHSFSGLRSFSKIQLDIWAFSTGSSSFLKAFHKSFDTFLTIKKYIQSKVGEKTIL